MLPSLHVALAVCCVVAFRKNALRWGQWLLWFRATAISPSTLLTHQHYLLDVLGGRALGLAA